MGKSGSGGAEIGRQVVSAKKTWVQTERAAHEAWAGLIARAPRAAMLLHHFVAIMGEKNAVVISQKTLAKMLGVTDRTVRSAICRSCCATLDFRGQTERPWHGVGLRGERPCCMGRAPRQPAFVGVQRYRCGRPGRPGRSLVGPWRAAPNPKPVSGEMQLPSGPGQEPPSQPNLDGMEPDLPSIDPKTGEIHGHQSELEARGQQRLEV